VKYIKYMSRVGKKPIEIPAGVQVQIEDQEIKVKGPKGELSQIIHSAIKVEQKEQELIVTIKDKSQKNANAFWGLFRSLVNNMVVGVTEGFTKQLEINGVGYKATVKGNKIVLILGFSHPVEFDLPAEVKAEVEKNILTISGIDKQLVGEVAANIRKIKKPEPYKGTGIKYVDEVIRRKVGKAAVKSE